MDGEPENKEIFFCHNNKDQNEVFKLVEKFQAAGFTCWIDEQDASGEPNLPQAIERGILATPVMLVCLGAYGIGKTQDKEINFRVQNKPEHEGRIRAVYLRSANEKTRIPLMIQGPVHYDLRVDAAKTEETLMRHCRDFIDKRPADQDTEPSEHVPSEEEIYLLNLAARLLDKKPSTLFAQRSLRENNLSHETILQLIEEVQRERLVIPPAAWSNPDRSLRELAVLLQDLLKAQALEGREFPASATQQSVWYLNELRDESAAVSRLMRVPEILSPDMLQTALEHIMERHQALRATLRMGPDGLKVSLTESPEYHLRIGDASFWEHDEYEELLRAMLESREDGSAGRDNQLLNVFAHHIAGDTTVLLFSASLLICDEASLNQIVQELEVIFSAMRAGEKYALPPVPDFSREISTEHPRDEKQSTALREFWRDNLKGAPPFLELFESGILTPRRDAVSDRHRFEIHQAIAARLREFARRESIHSESITLAVLLSLLRYQSGREDLVVGIAERMSGYPMGLVGNFSNCLPLRLFVGPELNLMELAGRAQEVLAQARAHGDYPFASMVRDQASPRLPGIHPIFQVLFQYEQEDGRTDAGDATTIFHRPLFQDMAFRISERSNSLHIEIHYSIDLCSRDTITTFAGHFERLLSDALDSPLAPLSTPAAHRPDAEREERIPDPLDYADIARLEHLFEARVVDLPGAVAIADADGQQLTYLELDLRARRLALRLSAHASFKGGKIPLIAPPSIEFVAGMLAILKAGATCVPLEPNFADEPDVLLETLDYLQPDLILAHEMFRKEMESMREYPVLFPAGTAPETNAYSSPRMSIERSSPALMFPEHEKSRSIAVTHYAAVSSIIGLKDTTQPSVVRRTALCSRATTVASYHEIFLTLSTGGTLVATSRSLDENPYYFLEVLNDAKIERLFLSRHEFRRLYQSLDQIGPMPAFLRELNVIEELSDGEPVLPPTQSLFRGCDIRWFLARPEMGFVAMRKAPREFGGGGTTLLKPLPNGTEIRVLDSRGNQRGAGITGTLFVSGPSVTNSRRDESRPPLYNTGLRARLREEGELEILGREDRFVEIRGMRIQLEDIEKHILRHPAVQDAFVDIHGPSKDRIRAYIASPHIPEQLSVSFPCEIETHEQGILPARIRDISKTGISVLTNAEKLERGMHVRVSFQPLQTSERIQLEGVVNFVASEGMAGIHFVANPAAEALLTEALTHLADIAYENFSAEKGYDLRHAIQLPCSIQPGRGTPLPGIFKTISLSLNNVEIRVSSKARFKHHDVYMLRLFLPWAPSEIRVRARFEWEQGDRAVFSFAHGPNSQDELKALLNTRIHQLLSLPDLENFLRERIAEPFVPGKLFPMTHLRRRPDGSPVLVARPDSSGSENARQAALNPLEGIVLRICSETLQAEPTMDENLLNRGLDSFALLRIHNALETEFSIPIPLERLLADPSPRGFAALVSKIKIGPDADSQGAKENPPAKKTSQLIRVAHENPDANLRIFCMHPLSLDDTDLFKTWPEYFPEEVEIAAVKFPKQAAIGRGRRAPGFFSTLNILLNAIRPYLGRPFAFVGHGVGAYMAFELHRRLRNENHMPPVHLYLAGAAAPQVFRSETLPPLTESGLVEFAEQAGLWTKQILDSPDMRSRLIPLLRSELKLLSTYEYSREAPLDAGITVFHVRRDSFPRTDDVMAWKEQTFRGFESIPLPGNHYSCLTDPNVLARRTGNMVRVLLDKLND